MSGRGTRAVVALPIAAALLASSVGLQMARDRAFGTHEPADQVLYVQSPAVVKRLALSYQALAADVYWMRALQHFGNRQRVTEQQKRFELLHPLLDMATTLDPYFNIAYRFGAIFLVEPPPRGPGQPDKAIALLQKGIEAMPEKWQYMQDAGFVEYWGRGDYQEAARWFERSSRVPGAPWFLKSLAATTLAQGGQRSASRAIFQALAASSENEWLQNDAKRRLRQLDAMDGIDELQRAVAVFKQRGGTPPFTWPRLAAAGILRGIPRDPDGAEFALGPWSGDVSLGPDSPLRPLPDESHGGPPAPRP
jgi:tetratricopeptide (TPR) repeat protein